MTVLAINRNAGEPVYIQIAHVLEQEIRTSYEAGDHLPSENELAARFSVNRHTLRHAVDILSDKGLVARRHGHGTLVLDRLLSYTIGEQTRFTETFTSIGKSTDTSVIRKLVIPAHGGVAKRLEVEVGAPILLMETLRKVDGQPFCIISHFLSVQKFSEVESEYSSGSLYSFLGKMYGLSLQRKESLVTATTPIGDDAILLQIPQNFPILRVKSVNIDTHSRKPVEYSVTRFRADRVQLHFVP